MRTLCAGILLVASAAILPAAKNLEIYAIDVEGGQATLIVSPSGESMLVDTGWGGHNQHEPDDGDTLRLRRVRTSYAGALRGLWGADANVFLEAERNAWE